ncbi:MAG: DoxX family protein [Bacteroidetes bacterium]|nr:DoxX family protein [Bacteroidota bacterium]
MFSALIKTDSKDYTLLISRLVLGLVMLPHGLQKTLGLFGGHGFNDSINGLTSGGIPYIVALLVILGESIGSTLLVLGFLGRIWSFLTISTMIGAVMTVHLHNGFFMNWMGNQPGEGFEYHLLAIALGLVILIKGCGALSIDSIIQRHHIVSNQQAPTVKVA